MDTDIYFSEAANIMLGHYVSRVMMIFSVDHDMCIMLHAELLHAAISVL